ncbi:aminoglycoside phosphotransferase family protein [Angustibacter peucedani]
MLDAAVAEARRRAALSDRDASAEVEHYAAVLEPVCARWHLTPLRWLDGGAGTPTLAVATDDGTPAVLKVAPPGELDGATDLMRAADGRGYARVLRWSPDDGAVLLEQLGDDLWSATTSVLAQADITVPLLRQAWEVPLAAGRPFEGKARGLLEILADLGPRYGDEHPAAVRLATSCARALSTSEPAEVVCHGDPHGRNVLRRNDSWAFVDPDGFVGERGYDVGVVLRDACHELLAAEQATPGGGAALLRRAADHAAGLADLDPDRVWRWAYVERVTTGLYLRWFGHVEESETFLRTATLLAREA